MMLCEVLSLIDGYLIKNSVEIGALAVRCSAVAYWIEHAQEMLLWMEARGYVEDPSCAPFLQGENAVNTLPYTFDQYCLMVFVGAWASVELVERGQRFL